MSQTEKEELAADVLEVIKDCQTEDDAIYASEGKEILKQR